MLHAEDMALADTQGSVATLPMLLRRLLIKAQDWLALMAGVSRQRVPLKRMREVLHAGQRLGVDIPEVDNLRLDIRRREWEDAAKKVPAVPSHDHSLPAHVEAGLLGYPH